MVAVAGTVYYSLQQVPLYQATTTLLLNPVSSSPWYPFYVTRAAENMAHTYSELMRTRSFAELVAQEMGDGTTPEEVLRAISTRYVPDTQFFKISALHADPAKAQKLANTAAQAFITQNIIRQRAQQQQLTAQQDPIRELERQRLRELQRKLQDELDYYSEQVKQLQAQIVKLESEPRSEDVDQRILSLRQELIRYQSLRIEALGSLAQTQIALARSDADMLNAETAVVIDAASLPMHPLPRNVLQRSLLAMIASIGAGVGLAFLLEYVDYTVKVPEELRALYGMATLGVIGTIKGKGEEDVLVTLRNPHSPIAEAFRALRTNIQFASPDKPPRSLLITSAGPEEGKSVTAANLAVCLAQDGRRVIVVDADLRKPRLHRIFKVPKEPGFTNLMINERGSLEDHLQRTEVENLWVLPCGSTPPNPAELLGSSRAVQVMEQLKERADVVIYDSPPVAVVTDAAVLGSRVDAVLQVVLAGGTRRDVVLRGKEALERVGARILGPVLNRVSRSDLGYYYYYEYYHRNGRE